MWPDSETSEKSLDWIEYIQIEDQWYQITYLDNGEVNYSNKLSCMRLINKLNSQT